MHPKLILLPFHSYEQREGFAHKEHRRGPHQCSQINVVSLLKDANQSCKFFFLNTIGLTGNNMYVIRHIPDTPECPSFSAPAPDKPQNYSEASCTAAWEDATTLKSPAWN